MKALKKIGIECDEFYGNSAGSIIAACMACELGFDYIKDLMFYTDFSKFIKLRWYEYPVALFRKQSYLVQGDYLFWTVPDNPHGFASWQVSSLSQQRLHPFALPWPLREESKISIEPGDNLTLVSPLKKIKIDNNIGALSIEIIENHGVVQISRSLILYKNYISVSDYQDLLELWRAWKNQTG